MSRRTISTQELEEAMLAFISERGPGAMIDPAEIARALGGPQPDGWGPLMQPIRQVAVRLMKAGKIVILRKGRPVDPDDFRGLYRIGVPADR
jgi:hypothetical protein